MVIIIDVALRMVLIYDVHNVVMFFFICNQFSITGVSNEFDGFSNQCFIVITISIQSCLCDLCHKTVESCIRNIFDDSVDMCDDKTMIKIPF